MMNLPNLLNKLKEISFEGLEPKFKEAMEHVYGAVMNEGFEMNNEIVTIRPSQGKENQGVYLELKTKSGGYHTKFDLFKEEKEGNNFSIILGALVGVGQDSIDKDNPTLSISDILEKFKSFLLNPNHDGYMEYFTYQMKNILSLRKIMTDHLEKKISSLEGFLKEIKEDIKD